MQKPMARSSSSPHWEDIPKDILNVLFDKLFPLAEYTRCGLVCKSWLIVAAENFREQQKKHGFIDRIPLLMLQSDVNDHQSRVLYNIINRRAVFDLQLPLEPSDYICGFSNGWLAIASADSMVLTLFNLIRNRSVRIPLSDEMQVAHSGSRRCVFNVIVSARNTGCAIGSDNYVVVARFFQWNFLAYIRSGDENWTIPADFRLGFIEDTIFYKGYLYFLTRCYGVYSLDILTTSSSSQLPVEPKQIFAFDPLLRQPRIRCYIAESSSGDLLFIRKSLKNIQNFCQSQVGVPEFKAYRLQQQHLAPTRTGELINRVEVKSFVDEDDGDNNNNEVIFLGDNESCCVKIAAGCGLSNNNSSVCFVDDYYSFRCFCGHFPHDIGIFNIGDGSLRHLGLLDEKQLDPSRMLSASNFTPLWIFLETPNFHC